MDKYNPTDLELIQEVQKRLKAETIWFWIDHQNCYLVTSFFCDSSEKIKIGDLLSTREYVFNQKIKEIREQAEKRQASLDKVFQEINDIEFVTELTKRCKQQPTIALSMHPNQDHIYITGKDKKTTFISYLPIEIKEN